MKPDWKDAPEWAKWLAQDGDGAWVWFQNKPHMRGGCNFWLEGARPGFWKYASVVNEDFKAALERRP